jgi:hypothetical protein
VQWSITCSHTTASSSICMHATAVSIIAKIVQQLCGKLVA